jgi:hypothetical protein
VVEKALHRFVITKMGNNDFLSVLGLDMGIKNAFGFNDHIGALLAETVAAGEVHLGMAYPMPAYFFPKRLIDSIGAAGKASCPLANKDGAMVWHTIRFSPDS